MSLFTEALETFHTLLARAISEGEPEPTAMVLATADPDGRVSARTVLLKELDERGFVFFSNYQSNKGRQLTAHPRAALCFLWKTLDQQIQVKVEGEVEVLRAEESDAYFASRPRGSQIGAWASSQSQPIQDRQVLLDRVAELEARYQGRDVPRPGHWGGYRVLPEMIEFWYGRPYRLHERQRYQRIGGQWQRLLLSP